MFYVDSNTGKKYEGCWSYGYNETEDKTEFYVDKTQILEISGKLNNQEAKEYFKKNFEIHTREYYCRPNRSLHELKNNLAYYDYKGCHFRIFRSYEDGMKWLKDDDDNLTVKEFNEEVKMDEWLEDAPVFAKKSGDIVELHQNEELLFEMEKMDAYWQAKNCIGGATFEGYKTLKESIADMEKRYNIIVVNLNNIRS